MKNPWHATRRLYSSSPLVTTTTTVTHKEENNKKEFLPQQETQLLILMGTTKIRDSRSAFDCCSEGELISNRLRVVIKCWVEKIDYSSTVLWKNVFDIVCITEGDLIGNKKSNLKKVWVFRPSTPSQCISRMMMHMCVCLSLSYKKYV